MIKYQIFFIFVKGVVRLPESIYEYDIIIINLELNHFLLSGNSDTCLSRIFIYRCEFLFFWVFEDLPLFLTARNCFDASLSSFINLTFDFKMYDANVYLSCSMNFFRNWRTWAQMDILVGSKDVFWTFEKLFHSDAQKLTGNRPFYNKFSFSHCYNYLVKWKW